MPRKKEIVKPTPEPVEEKIITYRLSLMDSENRAVQIDIPSTIIGPEQVSKLVSSYDELLEKEAEYKEHSEKHDKEVEGRVNKIQREKQKELKRQAKGEE